MKQYKHFNGVYAIEKNKRVTLLTKNLVPKTSVYGEKLIMSDKEEYREWNHRRSKLAAGLLKGISQIGIKPGSIVLYLGASTGTTVSHVSDIVDDGFVFALDFAPRVVRELVFLAEERKNIAPLLEDAFHPKNYIDKVSSVDVVFQDIAQRNQVEIFLRNVELFLIPGGFGLLSVKPRSIDVTRKPSSVFRDVKRQLEEANMTIVDYKTLDPFEKDHALFVIKKKV